GVVRKTTARGCGIDPASKPHAVQDHRADIARTNRLPVGLSALAAHVAASSVWQEYVPAIRNRAWFIACVGVDVAKQSLSEYTDEVVDFVVAPSERVVPRERKNEVERRIILGDRSECCLAPRIAVQRPTVETICSAALSKASPSPGRSIRVEEDVVSGAGECRCSRRLLVEDLADGARARWERGTTWCRPVDADGVAARQNQARVRYEELSPGSGKRVVPKVRVPITIALKVRFASVEIGRAHV